jgi:hypothetical protein
MTDPTGRSFLSYRRLCADDARLLVEAQHDMGIPTWQDIVDLGEEPMEDAIRDTLRDPSTANAVLWLTPEVLSSGVIQKVEIPEILARFRKDDGFFVIPVLARGVKYEDVEKLLDLRFASGLKDWNLRRFPEPRPISAQEAAQVASWVLERRIERMHRSLPAEAPLRLSLFTREPAPFQPGEIALSLDWSHRFAGREARAGVWEEHLLPALRTVGLQIAAKARGRKVEAEGLPALPACVALGVAFLTTRRSAIAWRQAFRTTEQLWGLHAPPEESGFTVQTRSHDVTARDLAVLVSVTGDAEPAFAASTPDLPKFRATVCATRPGRLPHRLASSGEAVDVVEKVIGAIKAAQSTYREVECTHLFLAVPAGVALMVGQLANALGPLQTYEHIPVDAVGRYRPAVRLTA